MNGMLNLRTIVFVTALGTMAAAHAVETCLSNAAMEYGVPEKVLDAIRIESIPPKNFPIGIGHRVFGPMGLVSSALDAAQSGANIDAAKAKVDACENYRAAAWLLADMRRAAGGDLWEGVARFYGGDHRSAKRNAIVAPVVARVKKMSGEL